MHILIKDSLIFILHPQPFCIICVLIIHRRVVIPQPYTLVIATINLWVYPDGPCPRDCRSSYP